MTPALGGSACRAAVAPSLDRAAEPVHNMPASVKYAEANW